jgi:hypothetical protein
MRPKEFLVGFSLLAMLIAVYLFLRALSTSDGSDPALGSAMMAENLRNAGELSRQRVDCMTAEARKSLASIVGAMENPRAANQRLELNMSPEQKAQRARVIQSFQEAFQSARP